MPIKQDKWTIRLLTAFGMCFVTIISYKVFFDPEEITTGTAAAYATAMGIFPAAIGFIQFLREKIANHLKRKADDVRD